MQPVDWLILTLLFVPVAIALVALWLDWRDGTLFNDDDDDPPDYGDYIPPYI